MGIQNHFSEISKLNIYPQKPVKNLNVLSHSKMIR